jgi:hypothetical protein
MPAQNSDWQMWACMHVDYQAGGQEINELCKIVRVFYKPLVNRFIMD